MILSKTIRSVRLALQSAARPVVLVPTMGGLHGGHRDLIVLARRRAGAKGTVVVSIFVNPTQFGPKEDFSKYPRTPASDFSLCEAAGADIIFSPSPEGMYFPDRSVFVDESVLSLPLCGKSRPGHFRGVCTVVAKLFHIVQPDEAVFGEKDWQQLAVIRQMVRDLNFPVKIVPHPTVREADGLALSSRNVYLTPEQRAVAPRINKILRECAASGASPSSAAKSARARIDKIPDAKVDYVEAVHPDTLQPAVARPARLVAAVFLGKPRLIDNVSMKSPRRKVPAKR